MIYPDNFIKDEIIGAFIEEKIGDKRIPISAGFELTPFCNLNCIHCYLSPSRRAKILTNYQVKRILDILFENGTLSIFFTGGEVLTRHDFKDIYIYAKKKGFLVSILTNATLMSDDIIELFLEYPIEEVSFTMYGKTQETYESITRVPGSYQKFIHGMELLHKNKIPCEFKTVGMKQNLHECLDIVSLGHSLGFSVVYSFDMRPMNDQTQLPVDYRVAAKEAFWFDENEPYRRRFWTELANKSPRSEPDELDIRRAENYMFACGFAKNFVFINSQGQMQGCIKNVVHKYDLLNGDFEPGWAYLGEIRETKISEEFKCNNCNASEYCEQCMMNNIMENNDPEKPVPFMCEIAYMRKRLVESARSQSQKCD